MASTPELMRFTAAMAAATLLASLGGGSATAQITSATQPPAAKEYASSADEYNALQQAAHGGTKLQWARLPDWSGVWQRETKNFLAFDENENQPRKDSPTGMETSAPLTPRYRAAYEKMIADTKNGRYWDRISWCLPAGFPRFLAEPFLREFIVTPNETWITHEQINETRRIYTDGRGHIPDKDAVPLWEGDSIGFWNGDTLVIHTTHLKAGEYQRGNPDFSFNTSTVEQWRSPSPGLLEVKMTIYDPDGLLRPWHVVFHYRRRTDGVRVNYAACEENNNTYLDDNGVPQERLPGDPGYRDGPTYGIPAVALDSLPK